MRRAESKVDPQGIYYLHPKSFKRNESELSGIFAALACGLISSKEIPAYRFQSPLDAELSGLLPLMKQ